MIIIEKRLCNKEGCTFKSSKTNNYCGKHQLCIFVDETKEINKKTCFNYIRGCRTQLELDYKFSKCQNCLRIDRITDNKNRSKIKSENNKIMENEIITKKFCNTCCKEFDIIEFIGQNNDFTKTCKNCRTNNNLQDIKRDKIHRNKIVRQSERAQYTDYKKNAKIRNLDFIINYDEFCSIIKSNCYYCGILQNKGINGIDRIDSKQGYLNNNCVSCCKMCNYLKRVLDKDIFIKKIEHILSYQKIINGNYYPHYFVDHNNVFYKSYKNNANDKSLEFVISEEEFYEITKSNCYICGKTNSDKHKNGIDRFDNKLGYTIENSKSCCGDCNIMKRIYSFEELLEKFALIYEKHKLP
jgi:hypothetical protein